MRAKREGGNDERDSKKDDTEVLGLANVATECLAQSKSTSTLVSGIG